MLSASIRVVIYVLHVHDSIERRMNELARRKKKKKRAKSKTAFITRHILRLKPTPV